MGKGGNDLDALQFQDFTNQVRTIHDGLSGLADGNRLVHRFFCVRRVSQPSRQSALCGSLASRR